jgi:high affinity Mn2+ porin
MAIEATTVGRPQAVRSLSRSRPSDESRPGWANGVKKGLCHSVAIFALAVGFPAQGADRPVPPSVPLSDVPKDDWTGFYAGAHLGVAAGQSGWSATQPLGAPVLSGSLDFARAYDPFRGTGSYVGGFQGGYNFMIAPRGIAGLEADISFPNTLAGGQDFASPAIGNANYSDTVEMFGMVRGRLGYDLDHWLYYATGGLAWTYDQFTRSQSVAGVGGAPSGTVETSFQGRTGWTAGGGVEAPIAPGWTGKFEYLYAQFGRNAVNFSQGGQTFSSDFSLQEVRFGLNYKLDEAAKSGDATVPPPLGFGE